MKKPQPKFTPQVERALSRAVSAIVLFPDDHEAYSSALWDIVLLLGGLNTVKLLKRVPQTAYDLYCDED